MSPEVVIERCRLRVVRDTPWPWGPERDALVSDVLRALPQLIAEELARLVEGGAEGELEQPVILELRLQARDLRFVEHGLPPSAGVGPLAAHVFEALRVALERSPPSTQSAAGATPAAPSDRLQALESRPSGRQPVPLNDAAAQHDALAAWQSSVVRALLRHRELGGLALMLARAPQPLLESWEAALRRWPGTSRTAARRAADDELVSTVVESTRQAFGHDVSPALARRVYAWLELVARGHAPARFEPSAALAAAWSPGESAPEVASVQRSDAAPAARASAEPLDRAEFDARAASGAERAASSARASAPAPVPVAATPAHRPALPAASARHRGEVHVDSALPFLALVPLLRMGFVDALHAAVMAAGAEPRAVAAAFAYKLLEPPERGWLRSPAVSRAAAVFAAQDGVPESDAIAESARRLEHLLSPADEFLASALVSGHTAGAPLLFLQAPSGGVALVDSEGLFPMAWSAGLDDLPAALRALLARELVLIAQASADAACLAWLDRAGARFVTDAPPTSGEDWRRIGSPRRPLWSNRELTSGSALMTAARPLERGSELALELLRGLERRPSVPRAGCALERTLSVAAAAGLGMLAWELWREREPVDPLLALERMASLDARVTFDADAVRVRVPMGQRHQDLYRHGFTGSFPGVPWLDGRELVIGGG